MDGNRTGWRALPVALLVGLGAWGLYNIIGTVINISWQPERGFSPKLFLAGEGMALACVVLALAGAAELARRFTGRQARGLQLAIAGFALVLAADVVIGLVQFSKEPYRHRWVFDAYGYVASSAWLLVPIGFTIAARPERRVLGIAAVIMSFLSWPPVFLHDSLWGWLELSGKSVFAFDGTLRVLRIALLLALAASVAAGTTTTDREAAAGGFRLAAKALWLRVIAAVFVVLITLMMIGAKSTGGLEVLRLAMMAQGVVSVLALLMVGLGAVRAARAAVPELGSFTLVIGGGGSLWAAGVSLSQLPYLYHMLYGHDGAWSRRETTDWAQALSVAMPLVVIVGVALLATALSGFAARRGDDALRASAQGNGVGFIALMLVAIAIQVWMLPKSTSVGNFAVLSLLSAGAGLWATVLMAKLLGRGADALESEPGLPPASVVNAGA